MGSIDIGNHFSLSSQTFYMIIKIAGIRASFLIRSWYLHLHSFFGELLHDDENGQYRNMYLYPFRLLFLIVRVFKFSVVIN